jgi:hypothetical protein
MDGWHGLFMCLDSVVNTLIVDNFANFKMPFIDGAESVSTEVNNSKIRFIRHIRYIYIHTHTLKCGYMLTFENAWLCFKL